MEDLIAAIKTILNNSLIVDDGAISIYWANMVPEDEPAPYIITAAEDGVRAFFDLFFDFGCCVSQNKTKSRSGDCRFVGCNLDKYSQSCISSVS